MSFATTNGKTMHKRLIILGSGPAGYTAAIYAARAGLSPLLLTGLEPGGQLTITTDVENYPGFVQPIQGPWLVEQMRDQAVRMGTEAVLDIVTEARLGGPIELTCDSGAQYSCDALIIATGARARWLGLPSEAHFQGGGVSACATCDGFFYRGRRVVVVGGGNTAVEEALFLAGIAEHVTLIHRRDQLRAEKVMQERLFAHPKIDVIWNAEIEEIIGTDSPNLVTGVILRDDREGTVRKLPTDGVFIAIGHSPATELFTGQLPLKPGGYLQTLPDSTATSVAGVFAAGDVADDQFRQAVTAAGQGCMAALEADRYLAGLPAAVSPDPLPLFKGENMSELVTTLGVENFDDFMQSTGRVKVLRFWATWCRPCIALEPIYNEVAADMQASAKFAEIDIDKAPELAQAFGIRSVPTVLIMKDGTPADVIIGLNSKEKYTRAVKTAA